MNNKPRNDSIRIKLNSVYKDLLENEKRYLHIWGGSGGGKSVFAAQKSILRVVGEYHHRILCVRKVAKTLRSSVFQLLKDEISKMGLASEFKINKTEMRFTYTGNGNELLLAGLDDVDKLKSIAGITSIWIEEATELSPGDFDQLDLRLRGETPNYKQITLTYNPVDERHWIKARFHDQSLPDTILLHTTFKDNRHIDAEYRRVLENKILVNPNLYRIYYMGEWGREEVKRAYAYNFDKDKTVSVQAVFREKLPVYFSLDFNVEPFVCLCSHIWTDNAGMHYHIFKELVIEKNGDVYRMIDLIRTTFGMFKLSNSFFTGDAMQRKREVSQRNNIDAWTIIEERLPVGKRLLLPRANPPVRENRHLVNAILAFHPDLKIHPSCTKLIYELQFTEANEEGDLIKQNRANERQRSDALDTFRYQCNTHLREFLLK